MATAMGAYGVRVEDPADLPDALKKAFAQPGPCLIEVLTNRLELAMPPKVTLEQIKGFGLYTVKAVMNGQGDELFELAKTNLWR